MYHSVYDQSAQDKLTEPHGNGAMKTIRAHTETKALYLAETLAPHQKRA